jgi:hypothetical protein
MPKERAANALHTFDFPAYLLCIEGPGISRTDLYSSVPEPGEHLTLRRYDRSEILVRVVSVSEVNGVHEQSLQTIGQPLTRKTYRIEVENKN